MKNGKIYLYGLLKGLLKLSDYMKPYCYLFFFNQVIIEKNLSAFLPVVLLYLGVYAVQTLLSVAVRLVSDNTFPMMCLHLKEGLFRKYNEMELEQIQAYNFSDLVTRAKDDSENAVAYYQKTADMAIEITASVVLFVILLILNVPMTVVSVLTLPVSLWLTRILSRKSDKAFQKLRKTQVSNNAFLYENLQNWKELKLYNLQQQATDLYSQYCKEIGKLNKKTHMYWFLNRTLIAFKDVFTTQMGLYLLGGILILKGDSEVSVLLVFMQYYKQMTNQLLQAIDLKTKIGKEKESIKNIREVMEIPVRKRRTNTIGNIRKIEAKNVGYQYETGKQILKGIDLDISVGEIVGIVGKSGCGKSTLLKLLSGMMPPLTGHIYLNSQDMQEIGRNALYSGIGVIMQESYLFNLSIRENLLLAGANISEEEMWKACEKARIKDTILKMEKGLDTIIGEGGVRLSGGQRQRLVIARMLLYNPDVIILDEATSALDKENESEVVEALLNLRGSKTMIIVAHNVGTVRNCSMVYFIENGVIADSGSHNVLMKRNTAYRYLWGEEG